MPGSYEYATASSIEGSSPACSRHQAAESSGSSQAENGSGRLPCLRRLNRSSSAAATTRPSTTTATAGSWKRALTPRILMTPSRSLSKGRQTLHSYERTSGAADQVVLDRRRHTVARRQRDGQPPGRRDDGRQVAAAQRLPEPVPDLGPAVPEHGGEQVVAHHLL